MKRRSLSSLGAQARPRRAGGQSMVEFSVVCFFGLIGVIAIAPSIRDLMTAISNNYARYGYIVSVSEYPDAYGDTLTNSGAIDLGPVEDLTSVLAGGIPTDFPEGIDLEDGLDDLDDIVIDQIESIATDTFDFF